MTIRDPGFCFAAQTITIEIIASIVKSDRLSWVLAFLFGAASGYVHVRLNDSGLSVLMVTGFAMFLAYRRPQRLWWWAAIVGLSLPVAVLLSYLSREQPTLGMIAGSFAGLAFSIVAAVGGLVFRRVMAELFPSKGTKEQTAQSDLVQTNRENG